MFEPLRCENQRSTVSHTESSRQHHDVHHRVSVLRNSLSDGSPWSPEHRVSYNKLDSGARSNPRFPKQPEVDEDSVGGVIC